MREVNFSIPNVNKASVGITTALYDRRALDCTSTLPLINSLNHLAYLTTSSARIRDILTVDGGIERLVCILKRGRSKDMMDMWKWNLAFQCVVNIGVRGTENVRTRVVEADMVPVIATILDNYIKVIEKCREKAEEAKDKEKEHSRHRSHDHRSSSKATSFTNRPGRLDADHRTFRRQAPPPSIDVSATYAGSSTAAVEQHTLDSTLRNADLHTPTLADRSTLAAHRPHHHHHHHHHHQQHQFRAGESMATLASPSRQTVQPLVAAMPATADTADGFVRPVRDADRLASMAPFGPSAILSQPTSPTTPLPPPQSRSPTLRPTSMLGPNGRARRRPSIRHQNSTVDSDDLVENDPQSDESPDAEMSGTGEAAVNIQDITMDEGESILAGAAAMDLPAPTVSETQDTGAFNITHRGPVDGSIANTANAAAVPPIGLSPHRPAMVSPPQPSMPNASVPRYLLDRPFVPNAQILAAMPREEDVLMSLQLLAYVSKYCGLRSYFQKSHLVPRLKVGKQIRYLDGDESALDSPDEEKLEEEFLLPNDFNIFPLVEKFTVRHHSQDMQYWAGVVMRNLCRKDDTRGGIRQCAYYQCGKWEEFTRQFAKCRRCRRTKYCSKECQKSAWAFHRHWCVAASS
ncbi:MYND-type zinc finger protein MUB1 [Plectosphaerella plurivora]|uniref:MYND-type zinc finger protein samB n=1 Tax=Plectosphaerella plurivora TaxID=936078 RepID=A0A9P8VB37_9PEZI|nr:MYND-type zinc finger protein MUB1 [Plectosphaerella plurivora]